MNNKINAKTTDWILDPQFIESSERLAGSLMSSFPLSRVEALAIVRICALGSIGPGDLVAVKELTEYMDEDDVTGEFILESLSSNAAVRNLSSRKSPAIIGFRA